MHTEFAKWLICAVLLVLIAHSPHTNAQTLDSLVRDSSCYSAAENAAITRGLLELAALRKADSVSTVAIGYYRARDATLGVILDRYVMRRNFLGIGNRRSKRRLRDEILTLP